MDALFSLQGKVAVVTGAVGLLGRSHSRALAAAGAKVVVTDLNPGTVETFAGELRRDFPGQVLGIAADITQRAPLEQLRERALSTWGRVDVLVNNAAVNDKIELPPGSLRTEQELELARFEHYPLEQWNRAIQVNVTGTFLACQVLGVEMARQRYGSIINIASTYGVVAPDQSLYRRPGGAQTFWKSAAYSTTKGAVLSFTRFLAAYWGSVGVRVNSLSPGGVESGQEPYFVERYAARTMLGRMAQPSDYQGALLFLASDASAYMTGANLIVDGGWTAW